MKEIKEDRYRYVNLVLFIMAGCCNNIPPNAFTAVGPTIQEVYHLQELSVNSNNLIYPIMYLILIFPVNYILEVYGLKVGTVIGNKYFIKGEFFIIVGLLIRLLISVNYYLFLVGTFITGFGFCFMMNSPNKFANLWFPVHQIPLVNAVCIFAIFASDSIGSFASAFFIKENATKDSIFQFFLI